MINSPLIKVPVAVQLNRVASMVYAAFFAWPLWAFRHTISLFAVIIFTLFVFCNLLGVGFTFIRIPSSRLILTLIGLAIPAVFWTSMCLIEFSPPAWWEWPFALAMWFGIPISLAVSLFKDKSTVAYFTPTSAG